MRFWIIWDFFRLFFGFKKKLQWLLIKVTEVTTEHQKWPKVSQNSYLLPSVRGLSPPQKLKAKPTLNQLHKENNSEPAHMNHTYNQKKHPLPVYFDVKIVRPVAQIKWFYIKTFESYIN